MSAPEGPALTTATEPGPNRVLQSLEQRTFTVSKAWKRLSASPPPCRNVMLPHIHERLVGLAEDALPARRQRYAGREIMLRLSAAQAALYALRLWLAPSDPDMDETARRVRMAQTWIGRLFMKPCHR